jgi:hypothetical protein
MLASAFDLMKRRVMRAIDRFVADERQAHAAGQEAVSPWI